MWGGYMFCHFLLHFLFWWHVVVDNRVSKNCAKLMDLLLLFHATKPETGLWDCFARKTHNILLNLFDLSFSKCDWVASDMSDNGAACSWTQNSTCHKCTSLILSLAVFIGPWWCRNDIKINHPSFMLITTKASVVKSWCVALNFAKSNKI